MVYNFKKDKSGSVLIIAVLLMGTMLFLAVYFLSFSLTEKKISSGQTAGVKTYYLAEAGIAEMIWRLKNDAAYQTNFEENASWTTSFSREAPLGQGTSYEVSIANTDYAHAEIISVGKEDIGNGKTAQRVVKTKVYKAIGEGTDFGELAMYSDMDIEMSGMSGNIYSGSLHANDDVYLDWFNDFYIEKNIYAGDDYSDFWSSIDIDGVIQTDSDEVEIPGLDFNSASADSFRNRADVVYSRNQMRWYLEDNPDGITLDSPITYVEGGMELKEGTDLTVNGLLVVNGDLIIGEDGCHGAWWWADCGDSQVTVNSISGEPSGLIVKGKISFGDYTNDISINGVIYAGNRVDIYTENTDFDIVGGIISERVSIVEASLFGLNDSELNLTFDQDIVEDSLGISIGSEFSPVINIDHWEEEY